MVCALPIPPKFKVDGYTLFFFQRKHRNKMKESCGWNCYQQTCFNNGDVHPGSCSPCLHTGKTASLRVCCTWLWEVWESAFCHLCPAGRRSSCNSMALCRLRKIRLYSAAGGLRFCLWSQYWCKHRLQSRMKEMYSFSWKTLADTTVFPERRCDRRAKDISFSWKTFDC